MASWGNATAWISYLGGSYESYSWDCKGVSVFRFLLYLKKKKKKKILNDGGIYLLQSVILTRSDRAESGAPRYQIQQYTFRR